MTKNTHIIPPASGLRENKNCFTLKVEDVREAGKCEVVKKMSKQYSLKSGSFTGKMFSTILFGALALGAPFTAQAQGNIDIYEIMRMNNPRQQQVQQSSAPQQHNYLNLAAQQQSDADVFDILQQHNSRKTAQASPDNTNTSGGSTDYTAALSATWHQTTAPGLFSVRFPGMVNKTSSEQRGVQATAWESETGSPLHLFKVNMLQFSSGAVSSMNTDEFLFSTISTRARELGAMATQKRRINNDRYPGCMFTINTPQAEWRFLVRIDGDTVYTLSVCSESGSGNDGYADAFFNSFAITQ